MKCRTKRNIRYTKSELNSNTRKNSFKIGNEASQIKKKKKEAFDNFEIDIDIITCLDSILWWRVAGD